MGINIGAFICAFVCGTLGEKMGWHWGFGSAAVGMLLGLATYMKFRERYLAGIGLPPAGRGHESGWFLAGGVVLAALIGLLFHGGFFTALESGMDSAMSGPVGAWAIPLAMIVAVLLMCGWLISMQEPADRGTVASILCFIVFNTVFWIAFEQAGSSLNLFAEDNTNRVLLGWEVPTSWFQSINALCVILLAPLFAGMWSWMGRRGRDPKQATKIGLALLLIAASYLFMVFGAKMAATGVRVSMFWLTATYVVQTFGELCISPTGLGWVTKAAPARFVSLLMGIWFLSSFLAGVLGGKLAAITDAIEQGKVALPWYGIGRLGGQADYYLLFVIASAALGAVALASSPFFAKVLKEKA
jgi:POT family proton-dependent oligopeptide transporter